MSTAVVTPEVPVGEVPAIDVKAFMEARNKGEATPKPGVPPEKAAEPVKVEPPKAEEPVPHQSRSQRRQLNAAIREAAEARGRLAAIEEMIASGKLQTGARESAPEDTEPQRETYPAGDSGTAAYLRATQKWDKAQEAKANAKAAEKGSESEQEVAHMKAMDAKAVEDIKALPDWDAVAKAASEDEDAPELDPAEHPTLMGLLATSDMRAFALYHFAKHPDELQNMLDLSKNPGSQIRAFARLEGKLEKLYSDTKAAQADADKGKDRKHLAEAEPEKAKPGETATGAIPVKPKPSSEVAARGGQPAPDEPAIGSPAWMLKRNQMQYGH